MEPGRPRPLGHGEKTGGGQSRLDACQPPGAAGPGPGLAAGIVPPAAAPTASGKAGSPSPSKETGHPWVSPLISSGRLRPPVRLPREPAAGGRGARGAWHDTCSQTLALGSLLPGGHECGRRAHVPPQPVQSWPQWGQPGPAQREVTGVGSGLKGPWGPRRPLGNPKGPSSSGYRGAGESGG